MAKGFPLKLSQFCLVYNGDNKLKYTTKYDCTAWYELKDTSVRNVHIHTDHYICYCSGLIMTSRMGY